jgi:hypothetical protein
VTTTTVDQLTLSLAQALVPIRELAADVDDLVLALNRLGWEAPPAVNLANVALPDPGDVVAKLSAIRKSTPAEVNDSTLMALRYGELLVSVGAFLVKIDQFATALPSTLAAAGNYAQTTKIKDELPRRLLDLVLISATSAGSPLAGSILRLLGVFRQVHFEADHSQFRTEHDRAVLEPQRLGTLLANPRQVFVDEYKWSTPSFDAEALLNNVGLVLQALGARAVLRDMPQAVEEQVGGRAMPEAATDPSPQLVVDLFRGTAVAPVDVLVSLHRARASSVGASDAGVEVVPYVAGTAAAEFPFAGSFALAVDATVDVSTGAGIEIRPTGIKFRTGLVGGGSAATATGRLGIAVVNRPDAPLELLSIPGGSGLQAREASLGFGAQVDAAKGPDPYVEAGVSGGRFVVTFAQADGFLKSLLSGSSIETDFDARLRWSRRQGVMLSGSVALEVAIPVNKTFGPIELYEVRLGLAGEPQLELTASVTGGVTLGPVSASVERVGVRAIIDPKRGNLGPVDFKPAFKPPTALGIGVDAGPVAGGGFISFDPEKGRYAGFLQLGIGPIQVKAIGLLDTKVPGGQPGYSFLIIVSAEFPPIQLGFGFTLNGVGGLAGIQRTMVVDALQAGIRNHSVDHILFPEDPIRDAPQIVSDLQTIFPPRQGRYVFGPMAIIGYGTPALVEAELGILLELPAPVRLVLLGQISAILPPKPKEAGAAAEKLPPGLELHVDVLGIVDFAKKTVALDAVLHDSKLAEFPLFGDMALRASFGDEPAFAFAIGGFNPRFTPPPAFPALRRLTLAVSQNGNPQALLQCYVALTSNSLQFGARGDLTATKLGFSFAGWLGFDVLVVISPLSFVADLTAAVEVRKGALKIASVALEATLTGPTPWHLQGRASFDFIVRITVPIELTVGEAVTAEIPPADPWQLLQPALEDARNWSALPGPAAFRVCSLREPPGLTGPLIDPLGGVQVHQRVCPLNRRLERFGEVPPKDHNRFDLKAVSPDSTPPSFRLVQDYFAPAQFEALSDADRLSRPGFEKMDAGISLVSDAIDLGAAIGDTVSFDTTIVDAPDGVPIGDPSYVPQSGASYALPAARQTATLAGSAGGRSPLSTSGEQRFGPATDHEAPATLVDEAFLIVDRDTLKQSADLKEPIVGKGAGFQALDGYLRGHPEARGKLQVIPEHEFLVA